MLPLVSLFGSAGPVAPYIDVRLLHKSARSNFFCCLDLLLQQHDTIGFVDEHQPRKGTAIVQARTFFCKRQTCGETTCIDCHTYMRHTFFF